MNRIAGGGLLFLLSMALGAAVGQPTSANATFSESVNASRCAVDQNATLSTPKLAGGAWKASSSSSLSAILECAMPGSTDLSATAVTSVVATGNDASASDSVSIGLCRVNGAGTSIFCGTAVSSSGTGPYILSVTDFSPWSSFSFAGTGWVNVSIIENSTLAAVFIGN